jgi:hypothetical protein
MQTTTQTTMQTTTQTTMQTTTPLTHVQAQHILKQAKAAGIAAGQYKAAAQALKRNDLDAFERICRASHRWLAENGIDYTLTDGVGQEFYLDGTCSFRCTYKDGKFEGLAEAFNPDGAFRFRCTFKDGKLEGLAQEFYHDGAPRYRCIYKDGKIHGLAEVFLQDGTLHAQYTYKDGVKQ